MLLLGLVSQIGLSQTYPLERVYPELFSNGQKDFSYNDASFIGDTSRFSLSSMYSQHVDANTGMSAMFVSGRLLLQSEKTKHSIRIKGYNTKEGPYISSPALYFNYGLAFRLSQKIQLETGVSVGVFSRSNTAPSSTFSGNINIPNGDFALALKIKNIRVSAMLNQMYSSIGIATAWGYQLQRFTAFSGQYYWNLNTISQVEFYVYARFLPEIGWQEQFCVSMNLYERFSFFVGYKSIKLLYGGVNCTIGNPQRNMKLSFLYNAPFSASKVYTYPSLEIGLGLGF